MNNLNNDEIIKLVTQIEKTLKEYSIGWKNIEASSIINTSANQIIFLSTNAYIREKVSSILNYSKILFSERKHRKYNGGADDVKNFIFQSCSSIIRALN